MPPAPVYRHLDAKNVLLGLPLGQAFAVGAVAFVGLTSLSPVNAGLLTVAAYAVLRLALRNREDGFVRHWTWWRMRRLLTGGLLSTQARCSTPRFPHATYIERDVGSREKHHGTAAR